MKAHDLYQGRAIAETAGVLAAGINQAELKQRLWTIAENALGVERCASECSEALHMVKTELCTFCQEQQLIACKGFQQEECDLVQIITFHKRH